MPPPTNPYRLLSTREVYANPWIRVREDQVVRPGGAPGLFGVVEMKPGSTVLALTPRGDACLVREYKYGIGRHSLELISGGIDEGEAPLAAARRELLEETGLTAAEWVDLGVLDPFTTVIRSPNYLFLALDAKPAATARPDEGELLEVQWTPFPELVAMVMRSDITHGASCALALKAQHWLAEHRPSRRENA